MSNISTFICPEYFGGKTVAIDYSFSTRDIADYILPAFSTLCLSQYKSLEPYLGFGISSSEISNIAEKFSMIIWQRMGGAFDFPPEYIMPVSELSFEEIWNFTLKKLANLEKADSILEFIGRLKRDELTYSGRLLGASWNNLLFHWIDDPHQFPPLDISRKSVEQLENVLAQEYKLEVMVKGLPSNSLELDELSDKDKYLLFDERINLWIRHRAKLHHLMLKWQNILSKITPDEVKIFDEWGLRIVQENNYGLHLHFSAFELLEDFYQDDLL